MRDLDIKKIEHGSPPERADALFRQSLRTLTQLEGEAIAGSELNRLLRALLTIGCLLRFPQDAELVGRLHSAELDIDNHDLSIENPSTGELGLVLAEGNLTRLQHSIAQWLLFFGGNAQKMNQGFLEKFVCSPPGPIGGLLFPIASYEVLSREWALDEASADGPAIWAPLFRAGTTLVESPYLIVSERVLNNCNVPFWIDWIRGFHSGIHLDWDLQRRVALIDDAIWVAGPKAVAEEIERIRREMAGPAPLEREKLLTHVKHLLANPVMTESAALSAADTVERAIRAYKDEAPANCLPDGLEHLEDLPGHFRAIAKVVANPAASEGKEEELRREIENLHAKITQLERDLVVSRSKELKGIITTNAAAEFGKALGKNLGSKTFWGGLIAGTCVILGVPPTDQLFGNLTSYVAELMSGIEELPTVPEQSLPHVHDI